MLEKITLLMIISLFLCPDVSLNKTTSDLGRKISNSSTSMNSAYSGISKSYSLVNASAPKNCRTMFRQTIIYYENNIIKANNTYLRERFPDMDESFLAWHEEFKKGPATYATEVLQSFGLWYDPDLNDIVEITEKRPIGSETWKTLDDRRLLLWVSFFQGIMKITPRASYNEDLMKYETSLETNNALKVWWQMLEKFQSLGFHRFNLARVINYAMGVARKQAHSDIYLKTNMLLDPEKLCLFKKRVVLASKYYSVLVIK